MENKVKTILRKKKDSKAQPEPAPEAADARSSGEAAPPERKASSDRDLKPELEQIGAKLFDFDRPKRKPPTP